MSEIRMSRLNRSITATALILLTIALCGCAGSAGTASVPFSGAPRGTLMPSTLSIAGWYHGLIEEVQGSQKQSGYVTVEIKPAGAKISGLFEISLSGGSNSLTFSGKVVSQTKKQAKVAFTLYDSSGNRYAKGRAIVRGTEFNGEATVPPSGSQPEIKATFTSSKFYPP
jgi:hypothetical protein